LREIDPFTVIEYIKSSVEILMSMKEDEKKASAEVYDDDQMSQMSSARMGGLSSQYEQQLQQYESEVRNHIKIEQQLKLHIECV